MLHYVPTQWPEKKYDRFVFDANFRNISVISWREQILLTQIPTRPFEIKHICQEHKDLQNTTQKKTMIEQHKQPKIEQRRKPKIEQHRQPKIEQHKKPKIEQHKQPKIEQHKQPKIEQHRKPMIEQHEPH